MAMKNALLSSAVLHIMAAEKLNVAHMKYANRGNKTLSDALWDTILILLKSVTRNERFHCISTSNADVVWQ